MSKILVSSGLVPTTKDTLLDARTRVATFADIANIENPARFMVITVEDTGKKYEVKKLSSKIIGGIVVENSTIDINDPEALVDLGLAEELRSEDEKVRQSNEKKRIEAENLRKSAEDSRKVNETNRVSAEGVREASERTRVSSEETRNANEQTRNSNETKRQSQESTRQSQESARQSNESTRNVNESARKESESERKAEETSRRTAELSRKDAENIRVKNEQNRTTAENTRSSAEDRRVSNETQRTANETARNNAELSREQAEGNRASTFNTLKGQMQTTIQEGQTAVAATEKATSDAQKVVDNYDAKVAEQDGKLAELGSYIENPEYVRAYIDNEGRFLWGIKTDGSIEWSKGIPTPVRDFVESIDLKNDEEVNRINHLVTGLLGDVKNITDTHHYISNPEWMQITTNSEGQVLEGMGKDGKKFFPKQEMLEKYDDAEERSEMTLDKDGRILSFRDSAGVKHECRQHTKEASFGRMNLTKENGNEIAKILENVGFKTKSPVDFSNDEWIELPTPRVAAVVRLYVGKMPTSKTDNIEGQLEYIDKDGNYFKKAIVLNSQGSSSMGYIKPDGSQGNLSVDFVDCKVKFGKWVSQDSFHIKKYYIDAFRGQCVVGYHLMEQVYQTRALGHKKPFEYLNENDSIYEGIGQFEKDYNTGALCHPDGFPIIIYVNTNGEDKLYGVYAWCLKKHRDNYYSDKSKATNIILDGVLTDANIWNGQVNWSQFEIRNPKNLKDIDGNEYDGDNPRELSDYDSLSKETKGYIERLSGAKSELILNNKKEVFENYFLVDYFIDYYLTSQVLYNVDGFGKNWIWCTWDGRLWTPTIYDVDSIFGAHPSGTFVEIDSIKTILSNSVTDILNGLYANEISERYKELRDSKVFDVDNITKLLSDWIDRIGFQNLKNDLELFKETPSYRDSFINKEWTVLQYHWGGIADSFDMGKTYQEGEMCYYKNYSFKALKQTTGVPPLSQLYSSAPKAMGFFNSLSRVKNWLVKRLEYLDGLYQYNY